MRNKNSTLRTLAILATLTTLLVAPASALTIETIPGGFLVRLSDGESVRDGWTKIVEYRQATGAPPTGGDIIELGEGTFPLTDARGNPMNHRWYGHTVPPLTIRGAGAGKSKLLCPQWHRSSDCLESKSGLTVEGVSLFSDSTVTAELISVTDGDLTMRRVVMVDQTLEGSHAGGAITVFNGNELIEESILTGNRVKNGPGLLFFRRNDDATWHFRMARTVVADNTALGNYWNGSTGVFYIAASQVHADIEHSTVVDNNTDFVITGGGFGATATIVRSIVNGNLAESFEPTIIDSFVDGDPQLVGDGFGNRIPQPLSPVIDRTNCAVGAVDQRGEPAGVRAVYLEDRSTPCDYGAVEAQHHFCIANSQGMVTCDEGEIGQGEAEAQGCRLIGGLLDCTGAGEVELDVLGFGDSVTLGDARLVMQFDGNLVLYENGAPTWATATNLGSCIGYTADFRGGLIVTSDPQGPGGAQVCWSLGVQASRILLRQGFRGDPAQIVVEDTNGRAVWMNYQPVPEGRSFTLHGTNFPIDRALTIPGALAIQQADGNFVLYDTLDGLLTPLWATGTWDPSCHGNAIRFQADGNLVIGSPAEPTCFAAANPGYAGTVLRLHRPDGGLAKLSIYNAEGEILWQVPQ
ncbi:MAG: hypothetical protein AAF657_13815 [Acidobacteriota bacterium]